MNKKIFLLLMMTAVAVSCGYDSEESVLKRRLNFFIQNIPDDVRTAFLDKDYPKAKALLSEKQDRIKSYVSKITVESNKVKLLTGQYTDNEEFLSGFPEEDLNYYKNLYKVIDRECIQTFTPGQIIDYFQVEFIDRLAQIRGK